MNKQPNIIKPIVNREGLTWEEWLAAALFACGGVTVDDEHWGHYWGKGVDPTEMGQA